MAICTDETPRLHYYSLFSYDYDGQRQSCLQQMMRAYPPEPDKPHLRWHDGSLFRVYPRRLRTQPSQFSWTEANRFLYFWDDGLRTACKESRAALLQHLDRAAAEEGAPAPKRSDVVTARHAQGQDVYLRVRSQRDIVCLRFSPDDMAACVSLRWDVLLPRLPFFHLPYASDINIAFEFHDSWDGRVGETRKSVQKCLPEASDMGMVMRAHWAWMKGEIPRWTRLWLIDRGGGLTADYYFSRKHDGRYRYKSLEVINEFPSAPEEEPHTFTDGKDTYVENYLWEGQVVNGAVVLIGMTPSNASPGCRSSLSSTN